MMMIQIYFVLAIVVLLTLSGLIDSIITARYLAKVRKELEKDA